MSSFGFAALDVSRWNQDKQHTCMRQTNKQNIDEKIIKNKCKKYSKTCNIV